MPLNVLIVGAGCAGPAFAHLLHGSDHRHNITVVERSPTLRLAGQQIDIKVQGIPILEKMGLMKTIKSHCVNETGMEVVDTNGKQIALFGVGNATRRDRFTLTSEHEIMRGDFVKVMYEASIDQRKKLDEEHGKEGSLTYKFDTSMTELDQSNDRVDVTFSDGQKATYDLVVGADGQGSRTRRLAFGEDINNAAFKSVGIHAAYFTIPRAVTDSGLAQMFSVPRSRFIMLRNSNRPTTQAYLYAMEDKALEDSYTQPIAGQMKVWKDAFKDAGWQSERILKGMETCDDFYSCEIGQVHMKTLHSGRVVLLGDAGYCPSPFTGLGTTLSLVGSYLLAGELARNGDNIEKALTEYGRLMEPPIKQCQQLPQRLGMFFPSSQIGVWTLRNVMWAVSKLRLDRLSARWTQEEEPAWKVPSYPELHLAS